MTRVSSNSDGNIFGRLNYFLISGTCVAQSETKMKIACNDTYIIVNVLVSKVSKTCRGDRVVIEGKIGTNGELFAEQIRYFDMNGEKTDEEND